jgi:hypothetical protein
LGNLGLIAYPLVVLGVVVVLSRRVSPWFSDRVGERGAFLLLLLTLSALAVAFAFLYPLANSGAFGGGSDRDDANNLGTLELIHGRYPYYVMTYLGNPVNTLPGSLLLAIPFVIIGNASFQNFFWLGALWILCRHVLEDGRKALIFLWTILGLSPVVAQQLIVGGDYLSNAIFVLVSVVLVIRLHTCPATPAWRKLSAAAFLGLCLCSRSNFLLLTPLIFSTIVRRAGWRDAILGAGVSTACFSVLALPFYLHDPAGFAPLHYQNKFDGYFSFSGLLFPLLSVIIAVLAALYRNGDDLSDFLIKGAISLTTPVVALVLLLPLVDGDQRFLAQCDYGISFLFPGALGAWKALDRRYAT